MFDICERVAAIYRNPSPSQAAACATANAAGRPAFWTTTGWGEMTIQHVAWLATIGGELHEALARFRVPDLDPPLRTILEALVPLNHQAVLQLRMAYMSINEYPPIPRLWARNEKAYRS